MVSIIGAQVRTFGSGHFASDHAVVMTDQGDYKYGLEFDSRTWKDYGDYLDNAMSDFANEDSIGQGIADSELFYRLEE